jgi:hypothetical protein
MTKPQATPHYAPRSNSLADRVIQYFQVNSDEELDLDAIAAKFDTSRINIHTQLGMCVTHGYLDRRRNEDGEWYYIKGKGTPKAKATQPSSPGLDMYALHTQRGLKAPTNIFNLDDVQIEDNVPLHGLRGVGEEAFVALLQKLKAGQSVKLPVSTKPGLAKAITRLHKAKQATYTVRVYKPEQALRVWRTA